MATAELSSPRPVLRLHVPEPRYRCLTCHIPLDDAESLFEHLLTGCWDYDRIHPVPVMATDVSAELDIARLWGRALAGDDRARNIIVISLAPVLRKVCGQTADSHLTRKQFIARAKRGKEWDWEGDRFSIGIVAMMIGIKRWRNGCLPNVCFDDPRQRDTSESLRELKAKADKLSNEELDAIKRDGGIRLKTPFEFVANCAKREFGNVENGWCEVIDGKKEYFGGDSTHGVTRVPRRKKGGKARKRKTTVLRLQYSRDPYVIERLKEEAGVFHREIEVDGQPQIDWKFDIDANRKFAHASDFLTNPDSKTDGRFVRRYDWLTELIAIKDGILDEDGALRFDGWLKDNIPNAIDRKILTLMAQPPFGKQLSRAKAGESVGLTVSPVKTRLKRMIPRICKKLHFSNEVAVQILSGDKWKRTENPIAELKWVTDCVGDALRTIGEQISPIAVAVRSAA